MCRREAFNRRFAAARVRRRVAPTLLTLASVVCLGLATAAPAMELVSVDLFNQTGNAPSAGVSVNADGNFVAFYSDASDLVPSDTNQARDVFLRDRIHQHTELISVNNAGQQGNLPSEPANDSPSVDGDGQIVAFDSDATNLVANDTNGHTDVFVRLRASGTTEMISLSSSGTQGNGNSTNASIDRVGRFVAFQSLATNLVAGDTNNFSDIFVRDRTGHTTERLCNSVQANGASSAAAISADGNVVAFTSAATNLGPVDHNGHLDIYTCDRTTGTIDLVSVSSGDYQQGQAVQGNGDSILPAISEDGRYVAFKSTADNLVPDDRNGVVDVFVRDRVLHTTVRASVNFLGGDANDGSFPPSISYDGRFVSFGSAANNIVRADVNGFSSVFVRDLTVGITLLVDVNDQGEQANAGTLDVPPSVSGDGKFIGFVSLATNLTNNADLNNASDVFIQGNPFFCPDGNCPDDLICQDGMCGPGGTPTSTPSGPTATRTPTRTGTVTATPSGTAGPSDCCQCSGPACQLPTDGACPTDCNLLRQAGCLNNTNCATFTPTPTFSRNDCCQCAGPACQAATADGCPSGCPVVLEAACLANGNCATFTPTLTPSPTQTFGPNDCCQCAGPACQAATAAGCPSGCPVVLEAACLTNGNCATFTPTPTPTTVPTLGPNDCCQCSGPACQMPNDGHCPTACNPVSQAACLAAGDCATFTPTSPPHITSTPTLTPTFTPTVTQTSTQTPTPEGTPCPIETPCPAGFFKNCPDPQMPCACVCSPCEVPTCPGGGQCVFHPDNTCNCTCPSTPTPTRTATNTPVTPPRATATSTPASGGSPTPTALDHDACHCTVTPGGPRSTRGAVMWFSGVVALWLRRRRFAGNKRTARRRGIGLSLLLGLIVLWSARGARADGPIVGVDTGWSEPTSGNYRANVQSGFAVNPYVGYMFNEYLGLQGQMHIVYQGSDYHNDRNIPNEGQATTLLGWTAGPRFAYTLFDRFDCYATAQGGVFTGVSGRVAHTGAGFSAGPGINYNITPALGVGVFARYNYAYVHTSPEDVGAGQVPQERFASNIEWMTLGVGMRYSFLHEEAPPPPPPPPPPAPVAAPVKKRLILRAVYFDFDKSNIRPDAAPVLDEAVELLKQEGPVKVVAEGHTDAIGTVPYNLKLSERRASSVRQYLVDHGLNGKNIDTKGFGKSQPVATNDTAEGRAQNRRVELRVLQ